MSPDSGQSTGSLAGAFAKERADMEKRLKEMRETAMRSRAPPIPQSFRPDPRVPSPATITAAIQDLSGEWEPVATGVLEPQVVPPGLTTTLGLALGSAPRTDETTGTADKPQHASWHGPLSKPISADGAKSSREFGTQTELTLPHTVTFLSWMPLIDPVTNGVAVANVPDGLSDSESESEMEMDQADAEVSAGIEAVVSEVEVIDVTEVVAVGVATVGAECDVDNITHDGSVHISESGDRAEEFDDDCCMDPGLPSSAGIFQRQKTMAVVETEVSVVLTCSVSDRVKSIERRTSGCSDRPIDTLPRESRRAGNNVAKYRMRRGITLDSGAGDNVIPKRMINRARIRPSAGSKRGLHYIAANNGRMPNEGEVDIDFETTEGFEDMLTFQVADVNKPLAAVSDRVDNGCRVVFDKDLVTGQDLSYVYNKKTKKVMKLRREKNVWVIDAVVSADTVQNESFIRQG